MSSGVLRVRIDNPQRANALTPAMLDRLAEIFADPPAAARVAVLRGEGDRHFSSGLDLAGRAVERLATDLRLREQGLRRAAAALERCPIPVIAAANGAVFGGALELLAACDWRVGSSSARFGMPAARIGVVYSLDGLERFVAAIGASAAKRVFLTGTPLCAADAAAMRLLDVVVAPDRLGDEVEAMAAAVASAAPAAVAATRELIDALARRPDDPGLRRRAAELRERAFASDDLREGLAALRAGRAPRFGDR